MEIFQRMDQFVGSMMHYSSRKVQIKHAIYVQTYTYRYRYDVKNAKLSAFLITEEYEIFITKIISLAGYRSIMASSKQVIMGT